LTLEVDRSNQAPHLSLSLVVFVLPTIPTAGVVFKDAALREKVLRPNPVEASSKRLRVWQAVWKSTCLVAAQDKPQIFSCGSSFQPCADDSAVDISSQPSYLSSRLINTAH